MVYKFYCNHCGIDITKEEDRSWCVSCSATTCKNKTCKNQMEYHSCKRCEDKEWHDRYCDDGDCDCGVMDGLSSGGAAEAWRSS